VFIPNSKIIKKTLVNLTRDGMWRIDFLLGIAYEDDVSKALDLIVRTTKGIEGVMIEKEPFTVVEEMTTSTVNIRVFLDQDGGL
jgi:small-conductance mechanosensitive channel